jgi:hypothetical protein
MMRFRSAANSCYLARSVSKTGASALRLIRLAGTR